MEGHDVGDLEDAGEAVKVVEVLLVLDRAGDRPLQQQAVQVGQLSDVMPPGSCSAAGTPSPVELERAHISPKQAIQTELPSLMHFQFHTGYKRISPLDMTEPASSQTQIVDAGQGRQGAERRESKSSPLLLHPVSKTQLQPGEIRQQSEAGYLGLSESSHKGEVQHPQALELREEGADERGCYAGGNARLVNNFQGLQALGTSLAQHQHEIFCGFAARHGSQGSSNQLGARPPLLHPGQES